MSNLFPTNKSHCAQFAIYLRLCAAQTRMVTCTCSRVAVLTKWPDNNISNGWREWYLFILLLCSWCSVFFVFLPSFKFKNVDVPSRKHRCMIKWSNGKQITTLKPLKMATQSKKALAMKLPHPQMMNQVPCFSRFSFQIQVQIEECFWEEMPRKKSSWRSAAFVYRAVSLWSRHFGGRVCIPIMAHIPTWPSWCSFFWTAFSFFFNALFEGKCDL